MPAISTAGAMIGAKIRTALIFPVATQVASPACKRKRACSGFRRRTSRERSSPARQGAQRRERPGTAADARVRIAETLALVTAYAILRVHGADLGNADYVAHMFAFLRPPATA